MVAWMAAGVKTAAFAAMLRVLVVTLGTHASDWRPAVAALAAASVVVGVCAAAIPKMDNSKELLGAVQVDFVMPTFAPGLSHRIACAGKKSHISI